MRIDKNKTKICFSSCKKFVLAVFLSLLLCFSPAHKSEAALWPYIDPIYKQVLETMYDQLQSVIMGALKQSAVKMINEQVNKLVGGASGSGGAMFITNWEDFLVTQPRNQTNSYMNDYLSQLTMGRGSYSSYVPISGSYGSVLGASDFKTNEGFSGGNYYMTDMLNTARSSTTDRQEPQPTYEGDPSQMFASGNFKNMNLYLSGINNPWAFQINAQNKYQEYLQNQKQIAFAQSVAYQGYQGTQRNGMIVTPGSTIGQAVANAQDLGNKILAAASHPGEMISAIVSQVVTQAIQRGIGAVSSVVDRQVNQVTDKALNQVNSQVKTSGPGALYNKR